MNEDYVTIKETYDKNGYLVKLEANDLPIHIPKENFPRINIIDIEWVQETYKMTLKEFEQKFGKDYMKTITN